VNYQTDSPGKLSLRLGDVVKVVEEQPDWYFGCLVRNAYLGSAIGLPMIGLILASFQSFWRNLEVRAISDIIMIG
jgi:hypothetical protein